MAVEHTHRKAKTSASEERYHGDSSRSESLLQLTSQDCFTDKENTISGKTKKHGISRKLKSLDLQAARKGETSEGSSHRGEREDLPFI